MYYPVLDRYSWGWWQVGTGLVWLLFIVIVFFVVLRALRLHNSHYHHDEHRVSPLDIARERYAKGEITKEEFDTIKKDLAD